MRIAVCGGSGTIGRHVVDATGRGGHDYVVLSPSHGVDVRSGEGLAKALEGVDVVVDVANSDTTEEGPATDFFVAVARSLQQVGAERGVSHIVTLSIVGIDRTSFGYYKAKMAQEKAAANGSVPYTILRATQMHELPAELIHMTRQGSQAQVFDVQVQPVAARTTGEVLRELAEVPPVGRAPDLAGPQRANLVDMGRAFADRFMDGLTVMPDTDTMADASSGSLFPGEDARLDGPIFSEWLASEDAATLAA
jgi:uncharacterized protein YbjT (DUF2867 family)